jgi:hypothetical protein
MHEIACLGAVHFVESPAFRCSLEDPQVSPRKCPVALSVALILAVISIESASAQTDAFSIGVLGADGVVLKRGELSDPGAIPEKAVAIRLTAVADTGAAKASGLCPGDIIIGVEKSPLDRDIDPVYRLMECVEAATVAKAASLNLNILRDGKPMTMKVKVDALGKHSPTCPQRCDRCDRLIQQSLAWLASQQDKEGGFPIKYPLEGRVVVASVCGLAFLASGSTAAAGPYAPQIRLTLDYVVKNAGHSDPPAQLLGKSAGCNQLNWSLGYSGIFLSEVYKKTPREDIKKKLEETRDAIAKNQEASGGWGHGPAGGGNPLGYVELEIMSNWCMSALGMMKQVGINIPGNTVEKGLAYIAECAKDGKGGVAYSTRKGQTTLVDAGRTAGAIFAFTMLGKKEHPIYNGMVAYFRDNINSIPKGHSSPVMHFMQGALACCHLDPECRRRFMELFRLELLAARQADGSMMARPWSPEAGSNTGSSSNNDRALGPVWTTANYLVVMQLPKGNLALCSGEKKKK